jgi:hypothetical protein
VPLTLLAQYDDFSGGHWGSDQTAEMAPKDTFGGINVMRYANGLLGPRPDWTYAGPRPNGTPFYNPYSVNLGGYPNPITIASSTVYESASVASTPSLSLTPTAILWLSSSRFLYAALGNTTIGDWRRSVSNTTGTLPTQFGGSLVTYGPARYAYIEAVSSARTRRIIFSGAGTPLTWPSGGSLLFVGVGDDDPIISLHPHRDGLIVFKEAGIFFVSGDPQDGTLAVRRVAAAAPPDRIGDGIPPRAFAVIDDGAAFASIDYELRGSRWRRNLGRRPASPVIAPVVRHHALPGGGFVTTYQSSPVPDAPNGSSWFSWVRDSLGVWSYWQNLEPSVAVPGERFLPIQQDGSVQPVVPSSAILTSRVNGANRDFFFAQADGVTSVQRATATAQLPARFFDRYVRVREAVIVHRSVSAISPATMSLLGTVTAIGLADPESLSAVLPVSVGPAYFQQIQSGQWQETRFQFGEDVPAARGFYLSLDLSHVAVKSVQVYGTYEQDRVGP